MGLIGVLNAVIQILKKAIMRFTPMKLRIKLSSLLNTRDVSAMSILSGFYL